MFNAIGGTQIKTYYQNITIYNNVNVQYLLYSVPQEITHNNIINFEIITESIASSSGLQYSLVWCYNGALFVNMHQPNGFGEPSISATIIIKYIV